MKAKLIKLKDKSLLIYLFINLIYILIGSYMVSHALIQYRTFSYGYIVLLGINILIILILFFKKKYKKNIIDIFLILIIIFAIISTIFAYKPNKALFGEWMRYEGLFTICYYITLVYVTSYLKKEDRKKVIYGILIFGLIQCLYAYAQKLDLFNIPTVIENGNRCATGFTSNRNFFGTLMLICTGYSIGLFIEEKDRLKVVVFLILTYLFFIGLLLSKTRSCFVGLFALMVILFIYGIKNKYIKKYIVLLITLILSILLVQYTKLTPLFDKYNQTKDEIVQIFKGNSESNSGDGRVVLWKETIKVVPRYIVHGVGVDNFANVLDGKPIGRVKDDGKKVYYDKAHNEYLQILVTMGIFSLISYLCLHFIIIKIGIKNAFKNKEIYLILPAIGYLIQAQFNISVITIAPIFYIGLGLLVNRENIKE